jgi:hypothetical protein
MTAEIGHRDTADTEKERKRDVGNERQREKAA